MGKVNSSVAAMSKGLADKPWCCNGNHLTLADIAVGCALSYLDFRFPQIDWRSPHANLVRLSEKLVSRPSFLDTQPPAA
jgi:glutathione S-transferase